MALRPEHLVGAAEIAARLGVGTSVVHDWQRRYAEFPTPLAKLRMGFIWDWRDVEAWALATDRL